MTSSDSPESHDHSVRKPTGGGRSRAWLWFAAAAIALIIIVLARDRSVSQSQPEGPAIEWSRDFAAALTAAKQQNKPILLAFDADWCVYCDRMKRTTYLDPGVRAIVAKFIPVTIDFDGRPDLVRRYGIEGPPSYVVLDGSSSEVATFVGYHTASQFIQALDSALQKIQS